MDATKYQVGYHYHYSAVCATNNPPPHVLMARPAPRAPWGKGPGGLFWHQT